MAIKSKTEILASIKERFGEDTSDSTLAFLEDVSDTFDDLETKSSGQDDWKAKYEENDKAWRQKYHDRFFSNEPVENTKQETKSEENVPMTYNDLFKEV